jgi:hypothetical protein
METEMADKKDRELSEKDLEKAAGGGQAYGTPKGKGGKSPLGTPPAGSEVGDAGGGDFGTPSDPYGDARKDKNKGK